MLMARMGCCTKPAWTRSLIENVAAKLNWKPVNTG
jgi:hypothetical protein